MTTTPKAGLTDKFRPPELKVCRLCKEEKPIDNFSQNIKNKDNFMHECRACKKEYEDRKSAQRKERATTFFDAKYFTLFLLLTASAAFSQVKDTTTTKGIPMDSIPENIRKWIDAVKAAPLPEHYTTLEVKPSIGCTGVVIVPPAPDTLRAILLVTLSPNGIAHARMGFVVIEQGKRPVYLDCRKRALKMPQVGWDFREVDLKYKQR